MKVRMLTDVSGTRDGEDWPAAGEVVNLPKDEATELIEAGLAAEHVEPAPVESAAEDTKPRARRAAKE